ncbi:hypothetical protein AncyloWKF20_14215 [Ancylobacter sp. WKF20]|uniref:hypothetical protein n=1 Tax=Ancylobacter sp. WKF20 TaxID=3039801 RepID=UPI0024344B1C|nr:hypothetical protein [Ancylobacter sp. WKF20]WGD28936.1 hypothetical protein AncyloWKF20_14215 [Ancylobacter sp. WKF20]
MNDAYTNYVGQSFSQPEVQPPRFIFVTPLLSEADRIAEACPDLHFRLPKVIRSKANHFKALVDEGQNIATTHVLFEAITTETLLSIRKKGYVVIIDEAMECVRIFEGLTKRDRTMLIERGILCVDDESKRLRWAATEGEDYRGRLADIKSFCDNGNLFMYRNKTILWTLPPDFFRILGDAYVLTYMFEGQPMAAYFKSKGVNYQLLTIHEGEIKNWHLFSNELEYKKQLRSLINVYKGSANNIGRIASKEQPLSSAWYKRQTDEELKAIRATIQNWFKKHAKTEAKLNAWTTYKDYRPKLSGAGYAKGFIPCNAKATNDHKHKASLAYMCNIHYNPYIAGYFEDKGISLHGDLFALSEMLQWIWRSRIRDGLPINLLLPSERMRGLLEEWLDCASAAEMIQRREAARSAPAAKAPTADHLTPHISLAPEAPPEADPDAFQEPSLAEDDTGPVYYLPSEPSEHGRWVSPAMLFDEVMQEFALAASEAVAPDPYDF